MHQLNERVFSKHYITMITTQSFKISFTLFLFSVFPSKFSINSTCNTQCVATEWLNLTDLDYITLRGLLKSET